MEEQEYLGGRKNKIYTGTSSNGYMHNLYSNKERHFACRVTVTGICMPNVACCPWGMSYSIYFFLDNTHWL